MNTELDQTEFYSIKFGRKINKTFFYVPVFYSMELTEDGTDWEWYSLRFKHDPSVASLTAYASKVEAGTSLKDALIRDLAADFDYPANGTFVIDDMIRYDTAQNRYGDTLTRILVVVGLDSKIDLSNTHPLGLTLNWYDEGESDENLVKDYFTKFARNLYHRQSYVHLHMDYSVPDDPWKNGEIDEYFTPDGQLYEVPPPVWFE